jgi:hypothetical protein
MSIKFSKPTLRTSSGLARAKGTLLDHEICCLAMHSFNQKDNSQETIPRDFHSKGNVTRPSGAYASGQCLSEQQLGPWPKGPLSMVGHLDAYCLVFRGTVHDIRTMLL